MIEILGKIFIAKMLTLLAQMLVLIKMLMVLHLVLKKMIDNQFKVGGAFGYIDSSLDFDSGQGRSDSESYYLSVLCKL